MSFPGLQRLRSVARSTLQRAFPAFRPKVRIPPHGGFQPYTYTLPDRYPWLFEFVREQLGGRPEPRLLSFGCSGGDEAFALRGYWPTARITGIDIDSENIARCKERAAAEQASGMTFIAAASAESEQAQSYDAVFCLAVLCHGDLTTLGLQHCDPILTFARFETAVTDLARCVKPGGWLLLHTTNFRFCDTEVAREFAPVLDADPQHMAHDVLFDRNNQLMPGVSYRTVGFRKHGG